MYFQKVVILLGMRKIYRIKLSKEERYQLEALTKRNPIAAHKVIKARALLLCDESEHGPGWSDPKVIEATGIKPATLERLRAKCCETGPLQALERKAQSKPSREPILDDEGQARLTALACSQAPDGRKRWTLQLLAEKAVELKIVEAISHETVRQTLKKTTSNPG
ncbi:MAG: helix-turn-helix domain-containing protein [Verrucomicrobiota bacterium]